MIAYRATLDVPRELAQFAAKLLLAERRRRGTPRGSRALTCFWQAVLGLRWFRDRTAPDALARDHGISRATAYRYLDEVIAVLADAGPGPARGAGTGQGRGPSARDPGRQDHPRRPVPGEDPQRQRRGHRPVVLRQGPRHGGNIQAVLAPDGFPLWVSPCEPGSVHDITAARIHALPALYRAAAAGLPTLADPGYDGAGIGIHIPVKQPADGQELDIDTRTRNALQRSLRCLGRTRVRPAHRPLAHPPAHHRQPQQDRRHRPRRTRPHPFRARLHHMKFAEITSVTGATRRFFVAYGTTCTAASRGPQRPER